MNKKKIVLVDGNNFFASCEQLMNPGLRGKPLCVLSNNDGCVIARSKEAKILGITMGMPYFMAKKYYPDAIYLSSDFALYHEISERMMKHLKKYSDKIDVYSIDEAFLDVTGADKLFKMTYQYLAEYIKNDIENNIGINVSVGLAPSVVLAKLANHKAKNNTGFYVIDDNLIKKELSGIPVEEIWGVGKNIARTFKKYGIFYANEILLKDDNFYKHVFGKKGLELKYELNGQSVIDITGIEDKPKSIQKTRAFPEFSDNKDYIRTELMIHLNNVCKKLRMYNLEAGNIAVMLRSKDFRVFYADEKLDIPVNSEIMLIEKVKKLFDKIYIKDIIYRASGVIAFSLSDAQKIQLSFFSEENSEKGKKISSVMDNMEKKFGRGILSVGQTGIRKIIKKHTREKRLRPF